MATAAAVQPFRALTEFRALPPGHALFRVKGIHSAPHLKPEELAVVDMRDRAPVHGELFVIQWESGARRREIVQARADRLKLGRDEQTAEITDCWWVGDLLQPRSGEEMQAWLRRGLLRTSDGPYLTEHLQSKLIGRVVGYAIGEIGEVLAPEAGWQDEEAGNAAFDPGAYIDVMQSAGFKIIAHYEGGRTYGHYEEFPEAPLTAEQDERVTAARWLYVRASTAGARVAEECFHRGLVISRGRTV